MNIHGKSETRDFLLRIFTVASISLHAGEWNAKSVYDPFWRFYVNERDGFVISHAQNATTSLRAGECYLVPAHTHFSGHNTAASEHFYIHFDVVGAWPFAARDATSPIIHAPLRKALGETLIEPLAAATRTSQSEVRISAIETLHLLRARALLHEILACCLEERILSAQTQSRATQAIRPALDFIELHLHERITNPILAERCHFSTDHFIEKFALAMGTTPGQYLMERRLSTAAQNLLFSNQSIDHIAKASGFCDRFHLSRAFKKRFGQTPVAYRKTQPV